MYKEMYEHDELENLTEEIVFEQIHRIVEAGSPAFSQTAVTIQDIAAIALNNLPCRYITNFLDKRDPQLAQKLSLDEVKDKSREEVLKAIDIVNKYPHD